MNIYNNLIFGNSAVTDGGDLYAFGIDENSISIFNNDFADLSFQCVDPNVSCVEQGNNINADPLLVDPTNDDFQLSADSPCIDTGDPAAPNMPAIDFAGNPRPAVAGTNPDMGALEFQPEEPTPSPNPGELSGGGCSFIGNHAPASLSLPYLIFAVLALVAAKRKMASTRL